MNAPQARLVTGVVTLQAQGMSPSWALGGWCNAVRGYLAHSLCLVPDDECTPPPPRLCLVADALSCPRSAPFCHSCCIPTLIFALRVSAPPPPTPPPSPPVPYTNRCVLLTPVMFYPCLYSPTCLSLPLALQVLVQLPGVLGDLVHASEQVGRESDGSRCRRGQRREGLRIHNQARGYGGWLVSWCSYCLLPLLEGFCLPCSGTQSLRLMGPGGMTFGCHFRHLISVHWPHASRWTRAFSH